MHTCIPLGFMKRVQMPQIVLAIVAMHEILVKKMEATTPQSLDASECLGGNREAKSIRNTDVIFSGDMVNSIFTCLLFCDFHFARPWPSGCKKTYAW